MSADVTTYFGLPCPLICLPVLRPILSCLMALSEVLKAHSVHFPHLLCFFKIVLITLPSLHFPLDFRISLALSLERAFWDSESVCIRSIDQAEGYRCLNKFKCPCLLSNVPRSLRCADVLRQLFRFSSLLHVMKNPVTLVLGECGSRPLCFRPYVLYEDGMTPFDDSYIVCLLQNSFGGFVCLFVF